MAYCSHLYPPNLMNSGKKGLALIASLILHAGLFLLLVTSSVESPKTEKIEFELVDKIASKKGEVQPPTSKSPKNTKTKRGQGSAKPSGQPSTTAAIPPEFRPESGRYVPGLKNGLPLGTYDPHSSEGAYGYMDSMGLEEATATMYFYQALWKRLDERMEFPAEIANQRIHGTVTIHANIDHRGQVVGNLLDVKSDEKILKTLALLVFHQSLKRQLPEKFWLPEGKVVPVVFTFDFSTISIHRAQEDEGGVFKNGIHVKRVRYIPPKLNEDIEYLVTKYMPPVIILPGFVYVDFIRAYQLIDNYVNERPDLYEQKQRRFDLFSRQLELAFSNEKPGTPSSSPSPQPSTR